MLDIARLKIGDKVCYQPVWYILADTWENGIVKEIPEDSIEQVRVVYNCGGNWKEYNNYTGALTNIKDLTIGWKH